MSDEGRRGSIRPQFLVQIISHLPIALRVKFKFVCVGPDQALGLLDQPNLSPPLAPGSPALSFRSISQLAHVLFSPGHWDFSHAVLFSFNPVLHY